MVEKGEVHMAKWKSIAKKYKDEWVLIEPQKIDENFNIQEGKIIAYSLEIKSY